jgi:hypothetical protein
MRTGFGALLRSTRAWAQWHILMERSVAAGKGAVKELKRSVFAPRQTGHRRCDLLVSAAHGEDNAWGLMMLQRTIPNMPRFEIVKVTPANSWGCSCCLACIAWRPLTHISRAGQPYRKITD